MLSRLNLEISEGETLLRILEELRNQGRLGLEVDAPPFRTLERKSQKVPLILVPRFFPALFFCLFAFESCDDLFGGGVAHLMKLHELQHPFVGATTEAKL